MQSCSQYGAHTVLYTEELGMRLYMQPKCRRLAYQSSIIERCPILIKLHLVCIDLVPLLETLARKQAGVDLFIDLER